MLVLALTTAQLVASVFPGFNGPLRVAIGVPFVVLVPGYAITAAVWPCGGLPPIERFALSVGLSLSLAALGGLLLYATGVGLWTVPWAILLGAPAFVGGQVAGWRRSGQASPVHRELTRPVRRIPVPGLAVSTAALGLSIAAVMVAVSGARQPDEDFSQLWLMPVGHAESGIVEVGLHSQELQPTTFHIQLLDGDSVALDTPDIQLTPGQTWTARVQLVTGGSAAASPIQALVYRSDAPETPYRRTELRPPQKAQ